MLVFDEIKVVFPFQVPMKEGNLIFSLVVDIILGYLVLELLLKDTKNLPVLLMGILEVKFESI